MKVSIITSCFNREKTIRDAIESVLSQDYPNIEYIIVDGASDDGSIDIINEYKDRISALISEPDNGMYEGINKGIRQATGEIIGLLHSDDFLYSPHTISHIVSEFKKTNAELIYGNGLFVDSSNPIKVVRNWISGSYNKRKIRKGWLPLHPTVYIRKKCFDKSGYYNEDFRIAADSDFLVRYLYKANFRIAYLNEYIVRMRMGGASTSFKKTKLKWEEDFRLYRSHGFNPYFALTGKILSKVPQFISARLHPSLK